MTINAGVYLVTGATGSGKTSWTCERMLKRALADPNIVVYSNIAIYPRMFAVHPELDGRWRPIKDPISKDGDNFPECPLDLKTPDGGEEGPARDAVVVIDEAGRWFPEGRTVSEALRTVLQQHRHSGLEIWFLLPSPARCHKVIRDHVHTHYQIVDHSRSVKTFCGIPVPPVRVVRVYDGVHSKTPDGVSRYHLDKNIFKYYNPQGSTWGSDVATSDTCEDADQGIKRRRSAWVQFTGTVFFAVFLLTVFMRWSIANIRGGGEASAGSQPEVTVVRVPQVDRLPVLPRNGRVVGEGPDGLIFRLPSGVYWYQGREFGNARAVFQAAGGEW